MTERKTKIRSLLARLDALQGGPVGREVDALLEEEAELARKLVKGSPTTKAVRKLTDEVMKMKRDPSVRNLTARLKKDAEENLDRLQDLSDSFTSEVEGLRSEIAMNAQSGKELTLAESKALLGRLDELAVKFEGDYMVLADKDQRVMQEVSGLWTELSRVFKEVSEVQQGAEIILGETVADVKGVQERAELAHSRIDRTETDFASRLSEIAKNLHGNGNANRDITIGGNASTLQYYTDINFKAGNNVTITYAPNHATQRTDVTISATGGGSSVTGIVRSIETVNTSQTMGDATGTDYVYIASAGINLTLPTAVGNENLYTIKNTSNSSVLVSTTGGESIDTDPTLILVTQYTSVDLLSNGVNNWNIT